MSRCVSLPIRASLALLASLSAARAGDWPSWRGPLQAGASLETGLPSSWSPDGENLLWKAPYGCRSTPIVLDGRLYLINRAGEGASEQERVMCLDAPTGRLLWEHRFNVFLTDVPQTRVGWASLCGDPETGNVYAHGVGGLFHAYDRDGKMLWCRSLTEEFGRASGYGGRTTTPVVDEDRVILGMVTSGWGPHAKPSHRYLAFDKRTGAVVYIAEPGTLFKDTTYTVPVITEADGQRLLIDGNADGFVYALQARTGQKVWSYPLSQLAVQASVVASQGRVYACHGEENPGNDTGMGRVVCLDAASRGTAREIWKADGLEVGYASPALHAGRLYLVDNSSVLHCLDAASGQVKWKFKLGTVGKGSPVWADGKLYTTEVNGRIHLLEPGETGCKVLDVDDLKMAGFDGNSRHVEIYGSVAVSDGRVLLPTENFIYCIGKKRGASASVTATATVGAGVRIPAGGQDPPEARAAWLQAVPAEVTLSSGESVTLKARVFDARGNFLQEVQPVWTLPVLKGTVTEAGVFSAPAGGPPQAGVIQAQHGELTAQVRVRVIPPLPWTFDFESVPEEKAPGPWVNAGKFAVRKRPDGNQMLCKPADKPGLARSLAYLGPPPLKDYTIQADLLATQKKRQMPDLGLINCRYILDLMGNHQKLQIRTWQGSSPPRFQVDQGFPWQPDVLYRMKLRVDPAGGDGKARIRGKVWKASEPEPEAWTIEATDSCGNTEGSPGLSGYSSTDLFYDNVMVTPNPALP
ncbi:MAG: PQQ-binding-like beta-propeller repeat protein [Planctomycetes bacterium]|nr:PQQ-binding-like beta-propeller repeat protein [Planctomycetota bacterium]